MAKYRGKKKIQQPAHSKVSGGKKAISGRPVEKQARTERKAQPANSTHKRTLLLLFLFGFLLYSNTITFDYTLDDKLAITHNEFTKKGFAGIGDILSNDMLVGFYGKKKNLLAGGRYRPLSMVTYAIEWEIMDGESPGLSHFINALLYGLTGLLLFIVLCKLFPPGEKTRWYLSFSFIATTLFIAHPLHTEVVANIKSRDEIMSLLGALAGLYYILKYLEGKNFKYMALAAVFFFLGLFSKEIAVMFLAVIPMTVFFFTKHSIKENIISLLPLATVTAVYLGIRYAVIGSVQMDPVPELMNDPFLHTSASGKYATIIFTMGMYIKLLFFPHPLTHDYYPWHPIGDDSFQWGNFPYMTWSDPMVLMSVLIYVALFVYALSGIRKKSLISYGILLFFITFFLFTNFFFSIGTFMNERFMYVPSIGFCMIIAYLLVEKLPKLITKADSCRKALTGILVIILGIYSIKTFSRNFAWENDFTLATTDVKVSSNSAKSNMSAGLAYIQEAEKLTDINKKKPLITEALKYLYRALQLYPTYTQPMDLMGSAYYQVEDYNSSIISFENCLKVSVSSSTGKRCKQNLEIIGNQCAEKGLSDLAIKCYTTLLRYDQSNAQTYANLGKVYSKDLGDHKTALSYLMKAQELEPDNTDILQKMGVVYAISGQTHNALNIFFKAIEIDPENPHVLMNIGVAYRNLGDSIKADQYLNKAFEINPSLKR